MSEKVTPISRAISDVLTGAYARKRLTQEELSQRTGIPLVTLQKKLRGRSPISATDLVVIAEAIGVQPPKMLEEAMQELVDQADSGTSAAVASILDQRQKKTPAEMTDDELEAIQKKAAINDTELEQDESDLP
jgi:transcriptional regulator with XRE-family HTH domain